MWRIILLFAIFLTLSEAFNIDLQNIQHFHGDPGSNFGFQMRFHVSSSDDSKLNLVVSAPKANSTGIHSGTVRYCSDVLKPNRPSKLCPKTIEHPLLQKATGLLIDTSEGYGSSLSMEDDSYMICAPRWQDTRFVDNGFVFMPGRCVVSSFSQNQALKELMPYFSEYEATSLYVKNKINYYGLANFGFSSDATNDNIFAAGAPGLTLNEGGIYVQDMRSGKTSESTSPVFRSTLHTTSFGYEGYEVKFGNFCDKGKICLAAGAPNLKLIGKVRIYEWENKDQLVVLQTIEGDNNWSYFGSVLCAVNVDADPYDELLIGAPLYTVFNENDYNSGLDVGRTYLYKMNHETQKYELELFLEGDQQINSRFGSSIESIGSINRDEFTDVVIGAPGEEDGRGCIYVYLGSGLGLSKKFSQKICASQLPGNTESFNGFGSSFSGSVTPKGSHYPVFAVGTYLSDTVTLFKCRPIVRLSASLKANPNPLATPTTDDDKEIITMIEMCLNFTSEDSKKYSLDLKLYFEIDTQIAEKNSKRAVFILSDGSLQHNVSVGYDMESGSSKCIRLKARIDKNRFLRNRFTPIEVVATYQVDSDSKSAVQDINDEKKTSLTLTFTNDCGDDNICHVDLKVQGQLILAHENTYPFIVVNHTSELDASISVTNTRETSYWTQLLIHVDHPFPLLRFESTDIQNCELHEPEPLAGTSKGTSVKCNYYLPLKTDSTINLLLVFDTEAVDLDKETVNVELNAMPMYKINPEVAVDDNSLELSRPIHIVATLSSNGVSSPSEVAIANARRIPPGSDGDFTSKEPLWKTTTKGIQLNHKIQIKNEGPSFLPKTDILLRVPIFLPDATQLVTKLTFVLGAMKKKTITCFTSQEFVTSESTTTEPVTVTSTNLESEKTDVTSDGTTLMSTTPETTTTTTESPFVIDPKRRRKRRSTRNEDDKSVHTYTLSCQDSPKYCQTYMCQLPLSLPPGGHAEVNVSLTVDDQNIALPEDYTKFELKLQTIVIQPSHVLFKDWTKDDQKEAQTNTKTVFHIVNSSKGILGIIIGSIIGGLILIVIIAIILWRLGFFKREKHYQVAKWKRESQRRSRGMPSKEDDGQKNEDDTNI